MVPLQKRDSLCDLRLPRVGVGQLLLPYAYFAAWERFCESQSLLAKPVLLRFNQVRRRHALCHLVFGDEEGQGLWGAVNQEAFQSSRRVVWITRVDSARAAFEISYCPWIFGERRMKPNATRIATREITYQPRRGWKMRRLKLSGPTKAAIDRPPFIMAE